MKKDKFEEILGQRLDQYSQEPPSGLFDRVEASLAEVEMTKKVEEVEVIPDLVDTPIVRRGLFARPIWQYAVAAVVTAGVFATTFVMFDKDAVEEQIIVSEVSVLHEVVIDEDLVAEIVEKTDDKIDAHTQKTVRETIIEKLTPKVDIYDAKRGVEQEMVAQNIESNVEQEFVVKSVRVQIKDIEIDEGGLDILSRYTQQGETVSEEELREINEQWQKVLAEENDSRKERRKREISASFYAGNVGFERGNIEGTTNSSNGLVNAEVVSDIPQSSIIVGSPSFAALATSTPKYKHLMPISVGVNVGFALNSKWALETGLVYTNLLSKGSNDQPYSNQRTNQTLNYIGIPLAVTYNVVNVGGFDFYTRLGVMIEKCVYAKQTKFINDVTDRVIKLDAKGFQPSADISLGVNYSFWKGLGAYVETGAAYYFPMKSQPESFRTENPLNLSLRFGFRYRFN